MSVDKSSAPESPMNQSESFEQKVEQIKVQWNETIVELLKQRLPQDNNTNLEIDPNQASFALETLTSKKETESKNDFIVLTAPTGVGKGTVGGLLEQNGIQKMPRVNTRKIRSSEVEGKDYYFVTEEKYQTMKDNNEMFCLTSTAEESNKLTNTAIEQSQAGILNSTFNDWINKKQPFYIDAGAGTARKIKEEMINRSGKFEVVFLLPPSFDEMINRVNNRREIEKSNGGKTMSDETLLNRLEIAVGHLKKSISNTDRYVVNDIAGRAAQVIESCFK